MRVWRSVRCGGKFNSIMIRLLCALVLANFGVVARAAQDQPPNSGNMAALQQIIKRNAAVEVPPQFQVQAAANVAQREPAIAPNSVEPPPGAPQASPDSNLAVVANPPAPEVPAPIVIDTPLPGQILYVALDPASEELAQEILEEKVAAADPVELGAVTVQSFDGAVRQLALDDGEVQLKSYVLVGQPLQYQRATRTFVGTIHVGVADLFGTGSSRMLGAPLYFEVLETAIATPQRFEVTQTSPPYHPIQVNSPVLEGATRLHVASSFNREGLAIDVPVQPTLIVSIDADNLRAFGMQTARITVTAVGGDAPPRGTVTLSAPGAYLPDGNEAQFNETGKAFAMLRTDSPGEIVVSAEARGYAQGVEDVKVIWPWLTLAFASFGGFVGGFVRLSASMGKGMTTGQLLVGLVVSIFLGLIVFALYIVGVKVLPVTFSVEVGDVFAFAAAALAGWMGTSALQIRSTRGAE